MKRRTSHEAKYKDGVLRKQASARIFKSLSGVFMTALPWECSLKHHFGGERCRALPAPQEPCGAGRGEGGRRFRRPHCHASNATPWKDTSYYHAAKLQYAPPLGRCNMALYPSGGPSRVPWYSSLILLYNSEQSQFPGKKKTTKRQCQFTL